MTLTTLRAKTRYLLGELTSDNYSDTNLDRAINDYLHQATVLAITSSGSWEVNGEVATHDIVAAQREYPFPADLIKLIKIETNTTGNTDSWETAYEYNERKTTLTNETDSSDATDTQNSVYLYDNSIWFTYPPATSKDDAIKVWYSKEATELTDGAHESSLPEHLHLYMVYGACMDYCLRVQDDAAWNKYAQLLLKKENEIKEHYTNRLATNDRPRIVTRRENYQ